MKAIILCGGEGSRLRPLTCNIPKPLTRLCGRPVLEYILDRLAAAGVTEAMLTVKYLADDIINWFEENPRKDITLHFAKEDSPLGTAGSVGNCREFASDSDFIIASGDALFDFDLRSALEFHKSRRAMATVITSKVDDPREYGSVVSDRDGKIQRFCEKPDWSQAVSNKANTGMYILNPAVFKLIPENTVYDFAGDLFPKMLSHRHPLYAYDAKGYWCDIGSIESYKQCQFDILRGLAGDFEEGKSDNGIFCRGELSQGNYTLIPPVYIGKNVTVGNGSVIGPDAVIDDNCAVGTGTTIRRTVVLENSYIGSNCELRGALLCKGSSVESTGRMFEGSVLGSNSKVGIGAKISTNVLIWPDKLAEGGSCVNSNLKWGTAFAGIFDEDGISGECGADITPELCAKAGQALATMTSRGQIAVGFDGQLPSEIYSNAFIAGASSCGARVIQLGECWDTMLMWFVDNMGLDAGVFFYSAGNKTSIHICGADGLNLTRKQERKFDSLIKSCDFARCGFDEYKSPEKFDGAKLLFSKELKSRFAGALSDCSVTCCCYSMGRFAEDLLKSLDVRRGQMRFHIAFSGHSIAGFDEDGRFISAPRMKMLIAEAVLADGEDVAILNDMPKAVDSIAEKYGRKALRYAICPADESDAAARRLAAKQRYLTDGITGMLKIISHTARTGRTLSELNNSLPQLETADKKVAISSNVQDAVRNLAEFYGGKYESDGLRIVYRGTDVFCRPTKRGNGLSLCVRAYDMETAKEFCAELEKHL